MPGPCTRDGHGSTFNVDSYSPQPLSINFLTGLHLILQRTMDQNDSDVRRKRAWRILALVAVIIIIVLILSLVLKQFYIPTLIGTILVVCVVAYVAHQIYIKKRQSMYPDVEAGRT